VTREPRFTRKADRDPPYVGLALWEGSLCFPEPPEAGRFRLLIEEFEVLKGDSSPGDADRHAPRRLIFAETVLLGPALPGAS
jgi:hypothetical protein